MAREVTIRIGKAASAFRLLRDIWKAKIQLQTKLRIYRAVVIPTLLYGAETWATTRRQEQRLDAFDSRCLRIILNIKWWHRKRNSDIRELTQQPYASTTIKRKRLSWDACTAGTHPLWVAKDDKDDSGRDGRIPATVIWRPLALRSKMQKALQ